LGTSILAASLTLAVMTLPVIIASAKAWLLCRCPSVACWVLGATRWQTIRHVVLPNSISGILTKVILQVSQTAVRRRRHVHRCACTTFLRLSVQDQCVLSMRRSHGLHQVPNVRSRSLRQPWSFSVSCSR
jgi:phosphate transport system permease protein